MHLIDAMKKQGKKCKITMKGKKCNNDTNLQCSSLQAGYNNLIAGRTSSCMSYKPTCTHKKDMLPYFWVEQQDNKMML